MHRDEKGAFNIPSHKTVFNSAGQDVTNIYKNESTPEDEENQEPQEQSSEAIQCAGYNEQLTLF